MLEPTALAMGRAVLKETWPVPTSCDQCSLLSSDGGRQQYKSSVQPDGPVKHGVLFFPMCVVIYLSSVCAHYHMHKNGYLASSLESINCHCFSESRLSGQCKVSFIFYSDLQSPCHHFIIGLNVHVRCKLKENMVAVINANICAQKREWCAQ